MRNVPEEENSDYSWGVRQSAKISFEDDLFIGQRHQKRSTLLAQTLDKNLHQHIEERVVEGQGNIHDVNKDEKNTDDLVKDDCPDNSKDLCKDG